MLLDGARCIVPRAGEVFERAGAARLELGATEREGVVALWFAAPGVVRAPPVRAAGCVVLEGACIKLLLEEAALRCDTFERAKSE